MTRYNSMQSNIDAQFKSWQTQKNQVAITHQVYTRHPEPLPVETKTFITISREFGCGGYAIGEKIAEMLGTSTGRVWAAYDKELLQKLVEDTGLSQALIDTLTGEARNTLTNFIQTMFSDFPTQAVVYQKLVQVLQALASNGNAVIIGRGGNKILANNAGGFHVRLIGDMEWKIEKITTSFNISRSEAEKLITEKTKSREAFYREFLHVSPADPLHYDLVINNTKFDTDETARLIVEAMNIRGLVSGKK